MAFKYITILLSCLCLLLTGVKAQDECTLAGFSLIDLYNSTWWKVPLKNQIGCAFASTDGIFQKTDCDIYFSVCHGLRNLSECKTDGDWSVCQKGKFNNQAHSANIANYKPINDSGSELNEQVGFQVFYTVESAVNTLCQNVTMNLTFLCDQGAYWPFNLEGGNIVPNGIDTYSFRYDFSEKICRYSLTFRYNGACYFAPTLEPSTCYIANYDFEQLTNNTYWRFDEFANFDICRSTNSCNIFYRLCNHLPADISRKCGINSAICINNEGTFYNLGNYTIGDGLIERPDKLGFMVVYKGGNGEFLGCASGHELTTTLDFVCNTSAKWLNNGTLHHSENPYIVAYDPVNCTAVFLFKYNGSCIEQLNDSTEYVMLVCISGFMIFICLCPIIASKVIGLKCDRKDNKDENHTYITSLKNYGSEKLTKWKGQLQQILNKF